MDTDLGVNAMTLEVTIDETQNIVRFKNTSTRTQDVIAEGLEIINNQYEKLGPVQLLVDWTEFKGQPDVIQGLLINVARTSLMVERAAIVAPADFEWEASRWQNIVEDLPIRRFSVDKYKDAVEWLSEPNS